MAGTPHRNLRMFSELCGDQGVKKVILVTTMWDKLARKSVGAQREHDLRLKYWRVMMEKGALVARFRNTPQTAWKIIDMIIQEPTTDALLLQEELVDLKLRLNETKAGMMLYSNLQELLVEQQKTIGSLAEQARAQNDPAIVSFLTGEYDRIEKKFQKTYREMRRLRIPIGRRIILFFSKKSRAATVSTTYSFHWVFSAHHLLNSAPWVFFDKRSIHHRFAIWSGSVLIYFPPSIIYRLPCKSLLYNLSLWYALRSPW